MANVVFLWHMHQPYYVNPVTRTAIMPWVRLHAVKGYLDMVSVIEEFPRIKVNFNLTPVLLLQIKELVDGTVTDRWLEWSRKPAADLSDDEKFAILENFFKINWDNLIKPYPRYWELLNKRGPTFYADEVRRGARYFSAQELLDLQVWFNLGWCGYTASRLYPELQDLREKGRNFTEEEKLRVLQIHSEILQLVLEKYAQAEQRGQAELTTTPFFHPILPLVYDSSFAERSLPGRDFPERFHWPDDAAAQLTLAVEQHEKFFGKRPRGLWPSEGSIAPELIPLMEKVGIKYFCSDEANLFKSLSVDPAYEGVAVDHVELFQGWQVRYNGSAVDALFRERPLSDFIGFMAAKNDPYQAAKHLLHHLQHIAGIVPDESSVIPLILDGENAWETFADGGELFLRALYGGIESDPQLHSCTIEEYLHAHPPQKHLTTLHTGSWIGSNFDIWIAEEEENRAWDLLGETRNALQKQIESGALNDEQKQRALMEIYAAEGSDWFWWYGPDFSTENDALFDELFRQHLKNVYVICGQTPPLELERPIIAAAARHLYELPEQLLTPQIDGRLNSFFEWIGAGCYVAGSEQTAMYRSERIVDKLHFACDESALYVRVDLIKWTAVALELKFSRPRAFIAKTSPLTRGHNLLFSIVPPQGEAITRNTLAADEVIEWAIAFEDIGAKSDEPLHFQLVILQEGIERERYPQTDPIQLTVPSPELALQYWLI